MTVSSTSLSTTFQSMKGYLLWYGSTYSGHLQLRWPYYDYDESDEIFIGPDVIYGLPCKDILILFVVKTWGRKNSEPHSSFQIFHNAETA